MLNEEEYDSDTSDEDYVPEGAVAESEEEDDGALNVSDEDVGGSDDEQSTKKKKRKVGKLKKKQKKNPLLAAVEEQPATEEKEEKVLVEDTKKEDSLWADFLADVDEKPIEKSKTKSQNSWAALLGQKKTQSTSSNSESTAVTETKCKPTQSSEQPSKPATVKITKVFEFAGEEVRVEEEVSADSAEAKQSLLEAKKDSIISEPVGTKRPLGLSGVVGLLDSKKKKLSTLEKTKIDWLNYKTTEGIEDEMQHHLKSKDGYLEKKEFLERADLRQFEIERSLRMSRRSKR